jgi:hypothetical protein
VEDCAEATLRIYNLLARVKNAHFEEDEFAVFDAGWKNSSHSSRLNRSNHWSDEEAG